MLSLRLFGPPEIWLDERPINIARRKSRALLFYTAASDAPAQRQTLLGIFWPDTEREAAQQVLRTSLHGLRRGLGETLVVERETVALAPGAWVDARVFERSLKPVPADIVKLSSILDLYRGEFLEGFDLPDSEEFSGWLEIEREHYRRLAVRAMAALSRAHEELRDYPSALAELERALSIDPLQEDLQRETIRLAYLSGDRAEAILRYDRLRRLLDEELGVPPMVETRALYEDVLNDRLRAPDPPARAPVILQSRTSGRATGPAALPFFRREVELEVLRGKAFSGSLILVEGEPGIGKTRLVEHFLASSGALALTGAAREMEQSFPYQSFIEVVQGLKGRPGWPEMLAELRAVIPEVWRREAARLLPELEPAAANDRTSTDEWRLWEGVLQLLASLARAQPTLLFIDDLQWADPSSLGLLGYLVRHGSQRLGFLAASRAVAPRSAAAGLLHALTRSDCLVRLPLVRFSAEDVREMAHALDPRSGEDLSMRLARLSEGNPYVLAELVRAARQPDGRLDLERIGPTEAVPGTVYSLIESRLARLSEPARRLLDAGVAIGRNFRFDLAARAAGISEDAALDGLDELLAAGLVQPAAGDEYRFDHSLTMEAAYRQVGEARHRRLHRQVAVAIENMSLFRSLDHRPGLLAFHYFEGNEPQRAAPFALQAGQQALGLAAWHEAAGYFRQALEGLAGAQRYPALMALGTALQKAGEMSTALEAFQQAAALAVESGDRAGEDAAWLRVAEGYLLQARYAESVGVARRVLEEGLPASALAAHLWWGTALSLEGADLDGAEEHLRHAAALLADVNDPVRTAQVEFELGSVLAQRGDLAGAVDRYRAALEASRRAHTPEALERRGLALNNLAYHLLLLGDATASEYAREGLALAVEKGLIGLLPFLRSTLGEIALATGDVDEAEAQFNAGLETARWMHAPERIAGLTANLGLAARKRGQPARARQWFQEAAALAEEYRLHRISEMVRGWLAEE